MTTRFDLHLSAYSLAPETIRKVEALGFKRDLFSNNTRCDTTAYHGTYRGQRRLPDDSLWQELTTVFQEDKSFVGSLEEEEFTPSEIVILTGKSQCVSPRRTAISAAMPEPGTYKACDIHININISKSTPAALETVEALKLASFDKPQDDGVHRVLSATCSSLDSGRRLFSELAAYLLAVPGLVGKVKFERTTRFLRIPDNAPALPLTSDSQLAAWLQKVELKSR